MENYKKKEEKEKIEDTEVPPLQEANLKNSTITLNLTVAEKSNLSNSSYFSSSPREKEELGKLAQNYSNEPNPSLKMERGKEIFFTEQEEYKRKRIVVKKPKLNSGNLSASNQIFELTSEDSYNQSKVSDFEIKLGHEKICRTEDDRKYFKKKKLIKGGNNKLMISAKKWEKLEEEEEEENLLQLQGNEFLTYDQVYFGHNIEENGYNNSPIKNNLETNNNKKLKSESVNSEISHSNKNNRNQQQISKSSAGDCHIIYDSNEDSRRQSDNISSKHSFKQNPENLKKREERIKQYNISAQTANFASKPQSSHKKKRIDSQIFHCSNICIIPSNPSNPSYLNPSCNISFKGLTEEIKSQTKDSKIIQSQSEEPIKVQKIDIDLKESITSKSKDSDSFVPGESIKYKLSYTQSKYGYNVHIPTNSYCEMKDSGVSIHYNNKSLKNSKHFDSSVQKESCSVIHLRSRKDYKEEKTTPSPIIEPLRVESIEKSNFLAKYSKEKDGGTKYIKTREDIDIVKYGTRAEDLIKRGYSATPPLKSYREQSIEKENGNNNSKLIEEKRIFVSSQKTSYEYPSTQSDKENNKRVINGASLTKKNVIYFNSIERSKEKRNIGQERERDINNIRSNLMNHYDKNNQEMEISRRERNYLIPPNVERSLDKDERKATHLRDYRLNSKDSKEYYKDQSVQNSSRIESKPVTQIVKRTVTPIKSVITPIKIPNQIFVGSSLQNTTPNSQRSYIPRGSVERRMTPVRVISNPIGHNALISTRSIEGQGNFTSWRYTNQGTPIHTKSPIVYYTGRNVTPIRNNYTPMRTVKTIRKNSVERSSIERNEISRRSVERGSINRRSVERGSINTSIDSSRFNFNSNLQQNQNINSSRTQRPDKIILNTDRNILISNVNTLNDSNRGIPSTRFDSNMNSFNQTPINNSFFNLTPNSKIATPLNQQTKSPLAKNYPQNLRSCTPPKTFKNLTSNADTIRKSPINPKDPNHPFNNSNHTLQYSDYSSKTNPLLAYMAKEIPGKENSHPIENIFRTPNPSSHETKSQNAQINNINSKEDKNKIVKQRILKRINKLLDKYDVRKEGYIQVNFIESIVKDIYSWLGVQDNISIKKDTNDYINGISNIEKQKGRSKGIWSQNGFKRNNVEEYLLGRLNYCTGGNRV